MSNRKDSAHWLRVLLNAETPIERSHAGEMFRAVRRAEVEHKRLRRQTFIFAAAAVAYFGTVAYLAYSGG